MSRQLALIVASLTSIVSAHAQVRTTAHPSVRILARVDPAVTVRLEATRPSFAGKVVVGSRLSAGTALPHLRLLLSSSPEQESALQTLMGEQQDKSSANYHKWLTPASFGQLFGPSSSDIAKVTAWLADQGLTVETVSASGRVITFSGDVASVESAFHTQINAIQIDGEAHFANTTDISIPEALAPVVLGVVRLNDVFPHHNPGRVSTVQLDAASNAVPGEKTPLYGAATGTHYVTPGDTAVIYNTNPLLSAGIDGTGQTVAIIAQSNIDVADVQKFRSMFGLVKNDPTITVVGQDPGLNQDDTEAYLDAEWGGALAPGAKVNFIVSAPSLSGGGVDGATLYAVENNIGDIISLSYGGCEYNNGQTYTAYWNSLWEQAASQGQTALVSSGDSGAAGCTSSSASSTGGSTIASVNSLGSSAYNIAVGGSIFVDFNSAQYWGATGGTTIPFNNALSYIPEAPLNQGRLAQNYLNSTSTAYVTGSGVFAAGGGVSIYTARPSWQTGSGIPTTGDDIAIYPGTTEPTSPIAGLHRLVPDLVNISAYGHDGTLFCAGSLCSTGNAGTLNNAGIVGGTSVATPVQAGIQALINQKNGGRQGNVLPILYELANAQYVASTTACQATLGTSSTSTPTLPASTCNFHDVVSGSITVPTSSSGTGGVGYSAAVGFDEASGLGSMNVTNVANNWAGVSLTGTSTTFSISPASGITHGTTQRLQIAVAPTSGTGIPTGDVSLIAETANPSGPRLYTLNAGSFTGTVESAIIATSGSGSSLPAALPAGSYNVHVHYAGDGTFAPSDSPSLPVSIGKEGASVSSSSYNITPAGAVNAANTFAYGADVYIDTFVTSASGHGSPSGAVTYTVAQNGTSIGSITVNLDGQGNAYFFAGQSFPNFYLKPNFPALSPGTYVVTANYAGDNSFNTSSSPIAFTVTSLPSALTIGVPSNITSGASTVLSATVTNPSTFANPNTTVAATGTVTFVDTTTASTLGSCTLAPSLGRSSNSTSGACSITTTGITASGANTVTATYTGDTNYSTATATGTVTVGTLTASTVTLTGSGPATVGYVYTLTATMNPTAATGTVTFYDGIAALGTSTLSGGVATLALGATTTGGGILTAGTHNFSAMYNGSTTYSGSTGTLSTAIAKAATAITLSSPANSTYGQNVIFSVSLTRSINVVTPIIAPTGLVNFYSDGTLVASGTPVFDPAGYNYFAAAGSTTTLPAGTHTITATYVGDANFNTSTASLTPSITVAKLTPAVNLASSATVFNSAGSSVTLTATIPLPASLAAPAGTVTFFDGTTSLGTVNATYTVAAGGYVATLAVSSLSTGTHTLVAILGPDANYAQATSNAINIMINSNNVWVANGNGSVTAVSNAGTAITSTATGTGGTAIAIDNAGDAWSLVKSGNGVSEFAKTGNLIGTFVVGGINTPTALAIDGSGIVWITNGNNSLSGVTPLGTGVSSSAYTAPALSGATSIHVDAAGSLWITNAGDNSLTKVIGVATPVLTPQTTAVTNATPAAKP